MFSTRKKKRPASRNATAKVLVVLSVLSLLGVGVGVSVPAGALAQTYSRSQLTNTIRSIERSRDFRNLNANTQSVNALSQKLQGLEREFVRGGCQSALNSGQRLNSECRTIARQIISGRRDLSSLKERVAAGQALANQRQQIGRQLAVQGGGDGSSANVQTNQRPANFFEQLFGALGGNGFGPGYVVGDEFSGYANYNTVRSVCVRSSDGYYWPISFSTVAEYLPNDASQCRVHCPGVDVDLYYYSNPGQEPKDMVNLAGRAYSSLPNAFAYRREFNTANSCRKRINYGSMEIVQVDGKSRTVINVDNRSVPLPLRDPRREAPTVVVAQAVIVPLPRPRPQAENQASGHTKLVSAELRVVEVNGKLIRIVGPDTPYAPATTSGS